MRDHRLLTALALLCQTTEHSSSAFSPVHLPVLSEVHLNDFSTVAKKKRRWPRPIMTNMELRLYIERGSEDDCLRDNNSPSNKANNVSQAVIYYNDLDVLEDEDSAGSLLGPTLGSSLGSPIDSTTDSSVGTHTESHAKSRKGTKKNKRRKAFLATNYLNSLKPPSSRPQRGGSNYMTGSYLNSLQSKEDEVIEFNDLEAIVTNNVTNVTNNIANTNVNNDNNMDANTNETIDKKKKFNSKFKSGNYLSTLNNDNSKMTPKFNELPSDDTFHNNNNNNNAKFDDQSLLQNLRHARGQRRIRRLQDAQKANREATRRTDPTKVIQARLEKQQKERKRKERQQLEKMYVERKERLDQKLHEEKENANVSTRLDPNVVPVLTLSKDMMPPLILPGQDLQLSNLSSRQALAINMAIETHAKSNVEPTAAEPIIAVIDSLSNQDNKTFATMAAIQFSNPNQNQKITKGSTVKLTAVNRAYLNSHSSNTTTANMATYQTIQDEELLSQPNDNSIAEIFTLIDKINRVHEERIEILKALPIQDKTNTLITLSTQQQQHLESMHKLSLQIQTKLQNYNNNNNNSLPSQIQKAQITSFAALQTLSHHATPKQLAHARTMTSIHTRLEYILPLMKSHLHHLKKIGKEDTMNSVDKSKKAAVINNDDTKEL